MNEIISVVIMATYISRELREWLEIYQAWRKERARQKDGDTEEVYSPPSPPISISFGET
ncbi:MAG: hypothetical protein IKT36_04310 [Methanocorpusculum sp.]|nr:hypothetical protein [Methanocorpusculum sp.]MBR5450624.1 hypothetical protein [Methanocorpusculum sp.]